MFTYRTSGISQKTVYRMGAQVSTECETAKEVLFTVHGELHSVRTNEEITPQTTLNTYLRDYAGLKGTKGMCYEGGCGACIVSASIPHPITKKERMFAVNSCLVPILACHGWNINTVDGIGDRVNGYHPIQTTLAKFNGSQCGYCSGGMVMNMYALYESSDTLTMNDVENSFGGNLCRCTGYRPILEAFKSLTTDAEPSLDGKFPDIEDLKICTKTGKRCNETCNILEDKPISVCLEDDVNWFKVFSIADILHIFQTIGDATYRIAAGNTGKGVFRIIVQPKIWIDVTSVKELISHRFDSNLILGGNLSLNDTMAIMLKVAEENPNNFWHLRKVYRHLDLVANVPVRNIGTIAGNLSLKHANREFPSDVFLLLETIGATLTIVQWNGYEVVKSLVEYLDFDMNKCIIKSITIPPRNRDTYLFESYKICPRVQNAHAYVNAALLVEHDGNFIVRSARICYGGIHPRFVHARNTEAYLARKNLIDNTTLQGALDKLNEEIQPNWVLPDATPTFRKNLALSLFYKFVLASAPKGRVNARYESGGTRLKRALSKGTQMYQTKTELYPLTQPINKLEAVIQCSGEAQYLNDTPPIPGELFGVFVLAEAKPLSRVRSVDTSEALKMPGVRVFVDYKDVPGTNSFSPPNLSPTEEVLFVVDRVLYNGQPIGIILADTRQHALNAARFVKVTYNASSDIPALNIKDVLKNNQQSRITNVANVTPTRRGSNVKQVVRGTFEVEGQYHFTMETQSCICIPTDDGGYDVNSATQWMDNVQASAARALNLPMNKINVAVKRLGGAYGAKILRASLVSTACVVAAHKVHKPVRIQVPLIENMKMLGKRPPTNFQFEVGVDDNGVIQYMDNTYYQDAGLSGMNENFAGSIHEFARNGYVFDTWKWNGNRVQTDMPGNAFTRGPATTEAIGMIETLMDQISYAVNKDPVQVRLANLQPNETALPALVKELMTWSDYNQRVKAAQDFNTRNRWMKKGLSLVIMNYPFVLFAPYSVFMSIYAQDGTVAISHGGIECGQGINTKIAQVCAYTLGIPLDMVSIKPSSCLNTPNNFATGGSITSEAVCYGIIRACREIQRRLEPVKAKMNNPTWKELVLQGHREGVELCATHMLSINGDIRPYPIYGVCAAEVQVDILTGEHNIIRLDLIEDVGQSMSPEIDVGQIEGAVAMGLGFYTCENLIYNDEGQLLTNSTWTYKVPGAKDIPADFRVRFRQDSTNPDGVLNSKAIAEPPLSLTVSIPLAIRRALASARVEADNTAPTFVPNLGPTTVEFTYLNALNKYKIYSL